MDPGQHQRGDSDTFLQQIPQEEVHATSYIRGPSLTSAESSNPSVQC